VVPLGHIYAGDIVVDRQIGGGSFGGVFAGSWNGTQVILKRANVRAQHLFLQVEGWMETFLALSSTQR